MVHKCINKFVPDYLADKFKLRSQAGADPENPERGGRRN